MNIKFCCSKMKKHFDTDIQILEDEDIYIMGFDGEYQEYFEIFTITYCPFCGKKIVVI